VRAQAVVPVVVLSDAVGEVRPDDHAQRPQAGRQVEELLDGLGEFLG
jgi:hypothetical protein